MPQEVAEHSSYQPCMGIRQQPPSRALFPHTDPCKWLSSTGGGQLKPLMPGGILKPRTLRTTMHEGYAFHDRSVWNTTRVEHSREHWDHWDGGHLRGLHPDGAAVVTQRWTSSCPSYENSNSNKIQVPVVTLVSFPRMKLTPCSAASCWIQSHSA
jgi:hypothetical protein